MRQLNVSIEDMTCRHCAARVQIALRPVPGVEKARVNLAEKTATINYDSERTGVAAMADAVRTEGLTPGTTKTRLAVKGMLCASCVTQVEGALKKTPGAVSASVNSATADIEYEPALIDVDGFNRAVEDSGYTPDAIDVTAELLEGVQSLLHSNVTESNVQETPL